MNLTTIPNFEERKKRWNHYWNKDVLDRPLIVASVPKEGCNPPSAYAVGYYNTCHGRYKEHLAVIDEALEGTEFLCEAIPVFQPDFGPDQFAAWLGSDFNFAEGETQTNWVEHIVTDWKEALPLTWKRDGKWWTEFITFVKMMREHSKGRYIVGFPDMHSNADALSALRGAQDLIFDFFDNPDRMHEAMNQVRAFYPKMYNEIYEAGGMAESGMSTWIPFFCEKRFAATECDYLALMSPAQANEYVIPALREEAEFLDHCIFHLDGKDALHHIDNILDIDAIDAIQWVPGAGQPPQYEWMDVLKKCQANGKGLQLMDCPDFEIVKRYHKELKPEGLVYCLPASLGRDEILRIADWLKENT